MVCDIARDRIVLFGSSIKGNLPEPWEWDGATWQHVSMSGPGCIAVIPGGQRQNE
jgi:hypothetical protein